MVSQSELKKYFHSIKKALRSTPGEKKHLLAALQSDVEEYLAENPEASMDDVVSHFGTPETIGMEHIQELPVEEVSKRINSATFNKKAVMIALVVVVVLVFVYLLAITLITLDHSSQYYDEEIITQALFPLLSSI